MFIGRTEELTALNRMHQSGRFECAVIYGRRRIGKTMLLSLFAQDKDTLFYSAQLASPALSLMQFSRAVLTFFEETMIRRFEDWEMVFRYIGNQATERRLLLILDEFPYMAQTDPGLLSALQHAIDHQWRNGQIFLILCGSTMSYMEHDVLGAGSPLFGRRTAQFRIDPFTWKDSAVFVPDYSEMDRIMVHAIWGGTPHYLHFVDDRRSIEENILSTILSRDAALAEEPVFLLKQEFREPAMYGAILQAIANGASKLNEIATQIGEDTSKCSKYLQSLIRIGLVERETPWAAKESSRKSIYRILDPFFSFWYRFFYPNRSLLDRGMGEAVLNGAVHAGLSAYVGLQFERICRDFLWEQNRRGRLPAVYREIGRWWGTDARSRSEVEIDIVAEAEDQLLVCECKWTSEPVGTGVLTQLQSKAECLPERYLRRYALFSKSGYASDLISLSQQRSDLLLFSLSDFFSSGQEQQ